MDKDTKLLNEAYIKKIIVKEELSDEEWEAQQEAEFNSDDNDSIATHITAIMEWGGGSGEEFMDVAMTEGGLNYKEGQMLYDLMLKVYQNLPNYDSEEEDQSNF